MEEQNDPHAMNDDKAIVPTKSAKGWIRITNEKKVAMTLYLEPWAADYDLAPGENVDVYVDEQMGGHSTLSIHDDAIVIFSSHSAIYSGEKRIWDFHDFP